MNTYHNPALRPNAQTLRRTMTKEDRHLWYDFLKELPVTFNRQKVMGKYIVDFYCAKARLVIELDGSQHYEPSNQSADLERDAWLSQEGIEVLRFSNADVNLRFAAVCEEIYKHIAERG